MMMICCQLRKICRKNNIFCRDLPRFAEKIIFFAEICRDLPRKLFFAEICRGNLFNRAQREVDNEFRQAVPQLQSRSVSLRGVNAGLHELLVDSQDLQLLVLCSSQQDFKSSVQPHSTQTSARSL